MFVFYAKPGKPLQAGLIYRFPINQDDNFKASATPGDEFTYTVEASDKSKFVKYYGKTNCYVVKPGETSVIVDVTPLLATGDFEPTGILSDPLPATAVAEMVWMEGFGSA